MLSANLFISFLVVCTLGQTVLGMGITARSFNSENVLEPPLCLDETREVYSFKLDSEFNQSSAVVLTQVAYLMEQSTPTINAQMHQWGFSNVNILQLNDGFRAAIGEHEAFVLLSIRGTATWDENRSNAVFRQAEFPPELEMEGKIHEGFLHGFMSSIEPLNNLLRQYDLQQKPIVVTGHSRGGALAILHALKLFQGGADVRAIYTFGQPRTGNLEFHRFVNDKFPRNYHRIIHEQDITPQVPPTPDSADAFADIFSNTSPVARFLVKSLVEFLDYHYSPGNEFVITDSALFDFTRTQSNFQRRYWQSTSAVLESGDLRNILANLVPKVGLHLPGRYVCALKRAIAKSIDN